VNPPQVAILATGRSAQRPAVVDGELAVRRTMTATLSVDHRALDGADAGRFLDRFKALMEAPAAWLT
jgi:pyruvate dehydrogenase E2 component (dihydrolipoamide acetyltransferase)